MIRRCAWCELVLGPAIADDNDSQVTHGICLRCCTRMLRDSKADWSPEELIEADLPAVKQYAAGQVDWK